MLCSLDKLWGGSLIFSNKVLCVRLVRGLVGGSNWPLKITSRNSFITTARSYRSVNPLIPSASSSPIREIASGLLAAKSASRSLARVANSCTSNVSITLHSSLPLCLRRFGLGVMNWWLTGVFWLNLWSMPMIAQWVFYWLALVALSHTCWQVWNWKNKQFSLLILIHYAFHKQFHTGWFSVADSTSYNVSCFN